MNIESRGKADLKNRTCKCAKNFRLHDVIEADFIFNLFYSRILNPETLKLYKKNVHEIINFFQTRDRPIYLFCNPLLFVLSYTSVEVFVERAWVVHGLIRIDPIFRSLTCHAWSTYTI